VVKDQAEEVLQQEVIKERNLDQVIQEKLDLKVDKCHFKRRVPKFGFTNINRKEFKGINLDTIQMLAETKNVNAITIELLLDNGLCSKKR
jgi:ribosomal protein L15